MQAQTIHYIPPATLTRTNLRVAAYCRVSSDSADQLDSYAAQLEHYDRLIGQHPQWELVKVYADEGLTGTRADTRLDFQHLLNDCRQGKIDKVLTKSISRFSRNMRDCLTSIRELTALGVGVFFEKENIDTGDMGSELMLSFYGAVAQEESLSISGNMRWSYQRRMKSGEFITCKAPFGYQLRNRRLHVDEDEAVIVRRIFEEYLSGIGIGRIVHALIAEGIPKEGGHWKRRAVEEILTNEKYAGNTLLQKRYTTDEFPFRRAWNKGECTMYYMENSHPPIISQDTLRRAQALRERRRVEAVRGTYPFTLMITCGHCGASFKRRLTRDKTYWGCRSHDVSKDNCPVGRISEPVLEQAFIRMHHKLRAYHHDILSPMLEQLTTLRQRAAYQQERIAEIDHELLQLGRQAMLLHRLHGGGHMDAAHYYEKSQQFNQQVNLLRRERTHLIGTDSEDNTVEQTTLLFEILKDSPERLAGFNPELFHCIVSRITVLNLNRVCFMLINGLEVTELL